MKTEVLERDNTIDLNISLSFINSYVVNKNSFIRSMYLTDKSFDLLLFITNYHHNTGKGISCSKLLELSSYSNQHYQYIYSMMHTLNKNDLIEYIGNGWNNCKLFAPTDKAIKGINNLVSSIKV